MNEFCNNVSTLKAFCNVGWRWSPYSVKVEGARDDVPVRMRANANREIRTRSAIVWRKIRITLIDSHFSSLDHGCNTTVVAPPAHCSTTYIYIYIFSPSYVTGFITFESRMCRKKKKKKKELIRPTMLFRQPHVPRTMECRRKRGEKEKKGGKRRFDSIRVEIIRIGHETVGSPPRGRSIIGEARSIFRVSPTR